MSRFFAAVKKTTEDLLLKLRGYGFEIDRELGVVYHIHSYLVDADFKEKIETYLIHDEKTGLMIFYSNYKKEDEIPKIKDFFNNDWKSFQLFLRPPVMEEIKDAFINKYENLEITNFTAKYSSTIGKESYIRPLYDRTIEYSGEDGKETLEEMKYYYGVSPTMIHVKIPKDISFRIKNEGIFTFYKGEVGSIKILFELMEEAINKSIQFLVAFKQISFKMLPVETETKSFDVPVATPALITLKNKLSYSEIDKFEKGCSKIGTIINSCAEEGSLFYSADIITDQGENFRIKANEEQIKFFPRNENCHFNTFMKFYKYIVDTFDFSAEFEMLRK